LEAKYIEILKQGAEEYGIALNERQLNLFMQYMQILIEWNEKINLTSITEPVEIIYKHFLDSILINKFYLFQAGQRVIDVGTGAGFPGIPLQILYGELRLTLLDSLKKRIVFLKQLSEKLDLKNIEFIHGRAEGYAQKQCYRASYDLVLSRAVAELNVLAEYCLPFAKLGGIFIAYKGPNVDAELKQAAHAIKILGGKVIDLQSIKLDSVIGTRTFVIIKKVAETPVQYPRREGIPSKKPL